MSSHKKRARSEGTSDRVFLNVGGEVFQTTISTLTANSQFFSRKFSSEWSTEDAEDEIFLDRDADSFRVLLSCMRSGVVLLPKADDNLCARVLLLAEYLGMEDFIAHIKAKAWAALERPTAEDDSRDVATAFSEEVGSL